MFRCLVTAFALLVAAATTIEAQQFSIADKDTGAAVANFTVDTESLKASLFVNAPKAAVRLTTTPLRLSDGRVLPDAVKATVVGAPPRADGAVDLTAGRHEIRLDASLAEIGSYRTALVFELADQPGTREALPIAIERRALSLPDGFVEIPAHARIDLPFCAVFKAATVATGGVLRNTLGRPVVMASPQVVEVSETSGNVDYALTVVQSRSQLKCGDKATADGTLAPSEVCRFEATLSKLPGAGIYNVKFAVPGAQVNATVNRTTRLSLRHSWVLAALLIIIGAGAALFVRSYMTTGRKLFAQLGAAAELRERIERLQRGQLGTEARVQVDRVATFPEALIAKLSGKAEAEARIDGLRQQIEILERWVGLENKYERLSDDDRDFVDTRRRAVLAIFEAPADAVNADRVTAFNAYSDAVLACEEVAKLRPQVERTAQAIRGYLLRIVRTAPPHAEAVAQDRRELEHALQAALRLLGDRNADDLRPALRTVQQKYRALALKLLQARLGGAPPWQVSVDEWTEHNEAMQELNIELEKAQDESQADLAAARMLGTHAAALSRWLKRDLETAASNAANEATKKRFLVLAGGVTLPDRDLAPDAFEAWYSGYLSTQARARQPSAAARTTEAVEASVPAEPAAANFDLGDWWDRPRMRMDSAGYAARAQALEFAVLILTLLFVMLSGLQALWINRFDWGSGSDIIVALLWGAGVGYGVNAGLDEIMKQAKGLLTRNPLTATPPAGGR